MTPLAYLQAVRRVLDGLEHTQLPAVEAAADLAAQALLNGGALFCHVVGHGNESDWLNRAGGLAALQRFTFSFTVTAPVAECLKSRPRPAPVEERLEAARLALRSGNVRPGDVLVLSSVSGRTRDPVDLALACREYGVKTIGFTSRAYSGQVESLHPSGKKLADVVDVAVDNLAPFGDAAVAVPGYDQDALPVSGVSMVVLGWMIWGRVMEKTAATGRPASVFMSVNRPGGQEHYQKTLARYHEKGF
jgi:uncharacterized phosphosugar-binding protein